MPDVDDILRIPLLVRRFNPIKHDREPAQALATLPSIAIIFEMLRLRGLLALCDECDRSAPRMSRAEPLARLARLFLGNEKAPRTRMAAEPKAIRLKVVPGDTAARFTTFKTAGLTEQSTLGDLADQIAGHGGPSIDRVEIEVKHSRELIDISNPRASLREAGVTHMSQLVVRNRADAGEADAPSSPSRPPVAAPAPDVRCCHVCTFANAPSASSCHMCGVSLGGSAGGASGSSTSTSAAASEGWACPKCTLRNDASSSKCSACGGARPGAGPGAGSGSGGGGGAAAGPLPGLRVVSVPANNNCLFNCVG